MCAAGIMGRRRNLHRSRQQVIGCQRHATGARPPGGVRGCGSGSGADLRDRGARRGRSRRGMRATHLPGCGDRERGRFRLPRIRHQPRAAGRAPRASRRVQVPGPGPADGPAGPGAHGHGCAVGSAAPAPGAVGPGHQPQHARQHGRGRRRADRGAGHYGAGAWHTACRGLGPLWGWGTLRRSSTTVSTHSVPSGLGAPGGGALRGWKRNAQLLSLP
ncbi:hypothetical protein PLESTM_000787000 [Pleodorina starrii]|nr:hypothetical protein PLESTM_000787000 [Pleodorina starrii]